VTLKTVKEDLHLALKFDIVLNMIKFNNRITINPTIRFGKPCIRGTRIAVVDILNLLSSGYPIEEIPKQYTGITKKDVLAAIDFASRLTEEPVRVLEKK
jgi:uncharacterized protein (DUF433 family)